MTQNFSKLLLRWYHRHKRGLPWRKTHDPYKIWVSEIMLQQTTVSTVIPRYERWVEVFPDILSLARASSRKVLKEWEGLGYYNRARNLHASAKIMCLEHHGRIPRDPLIVRKLPGFGPYTTGAVLSIAYQERIPIIDANVRRVIMRVLALPGKADTKQDKRIYQFLEDVMPSRSAGNFNQALMELGALICDQRKPLCLQCPLKSLCLTYHKDIQETIPQQVKRTIKPVYAVLAIIENDKKYFIQKRPSKGLLADLWEFPGGKIEKNETPRQALSRELSEELGVSLISAKHFMKTHHFYTEYKVFLDVWTCVVKPLPRTGHVTRWVTLKKFSQYPFPSGSVKVIEKLRKDRQ